MVANLIALLCVVCLVDGQARTFEPGEPLPAMPDDEAERLVGLGAAREALAEAKPKKGKAKRPPAGADGQPPPEGDGEGDDDDPPGP